RSPPLTKESEMAAARTRSGHHLLSGLLGDDADVAGLRAFLALRHVELDLLVLLQVAEPVACDRAVVHEDVGATVVLGDEAEALLAVEPLHSSCSHVLFLLPCPDEPDRCSGAIG